MAAFEDFLAVLVGAFPSCSHERRDGVVLVVERVAEQQQSPLLGGEQEHQPHHHREGGFVERLSRCTPAEQRAAVSWSVRSSDWMSTSTARRTW